MPVKTGSNNGNNGNNGNNNGNNNNDNNVVINNVENNNNPNNPNGDNIAVENVVENNNENNNIENIIADNNNVGPNVDNSGNENNEHPNENTENEIPNNENEILDNIDNPKPLTLSEQLPERIRQLTEEANSIQNIEPNSKNVSSGPNADYIDKIVKVVILKSYYNEFKQDPDFGNTNKYDEKIQQLFEFLNGTKVKNKKDPRHEFYEDFHKREEMYFPTNCKFAVLFGTPIPFIEPVLEYISGLRDIMGVKKEKLNELMIEDAKQNNKDIAIDIYAISMGVLPKNQKEAIFNDLQIVDDSPEQFKKSVTDKFSAPGNPEIADLNHKLELAGFHDINPSACANLFYIWLIGTGTGVDEAFNLDSAQDFEASFAEKYNNFVQFVESHPVKSDANAPLEQNQATENLNAWYKLFSDFGTAMSEVRIPGELNTIEEKKDYAQKVLFFKHVMDECDKQMENDFYRNQPDSKAKEELTDIRLREMSGIKCFASLYKDSFVENHLISGKDDPLDGFRLMAVSRMLFNKNKTAFLGKNSREISHALGYTMEKSFGGLEYQIKYLGSSLYKYAYENMGMKALADYIKNDNGKLPSDDDRFKNYQNETLNRFVPVLENKTKSHITHELLGKTLINKLVDRLKDLGMESVYKQGLAVLCNEIGEQGENNEDIKNINRITVTGKTADLFKDVFSDPELKAIMKRHELNISDMFLVNNQKPATLWGDKYQELEPAEKEKMLQHEMMNAVLNHDGKLTLCTFTFDKENRFEEAKRFDVVDSVEDIAQKKALLAELNYFANTSRKPRRDDFDFDNDQMKELAGDLQRSFVGLDNFGKIAMSGRAEKSYEDLRPQYLGLESRFEKFRNAFLEEDRNGNIKVADRDRFENILSVYRDMAQSYKKIETLAKDILHLAPLDETINPYDAKRKLAWENPLDEIYTSLSKSAEIRKAVLSSKQAGELLNNEKDVRLDVGLAKLDSWRTGKPDKKEMDLKDDKEFQIVSNLARVKKIKVKKPDEGNIETDILKESKEEDSKDSDILEETGEETGKRIVEKIGKKDKEKESIKQALQLDYDLKTVYENGIRNALSIKELDVEIPGEDESEQKDAVRKSGLEILEEAGLTDNGQIQALFLDFVMDREAMSFEEAINLQHAHDYSLTEEGDKKLTADAKVIETAERLEQEFLQFVYQNPFKQDGLNSEEAFNSMAAWASIIHSASIKISEYRIPDINYANPDEVKEQLENICGLDFLADENKKEMNRFIHDPQYNKYASGMNVLMDKFTSAEFVFKAVSFFGNLSGFAKCAGLIGHEEEYDREYTQDEQLQSDIACAKLLGRPASSAIMSSFAGMKIAEARELSGFESAAGMPGAIREYLKNVPDNQKQMLLNDLLRYATNNQEDQIKLEYQKISKQLKQLSVASKYPGIVYAGFASRRNEGNRINRTILDRIAEVGPAEDDMMKFFESTVTDGMTGTECIIKLMGDFFDGETITAVYKMKLQPSDLVLINGTPLSDYVEAKYKSESIDQNKEYLCYAELFRAIAKGDATISVMGIGIDEEGKYELTEPRVLYPAGMEKMVSGYIEFRNFTNYVHSALLDVRKELQSTQDDPDNNFTNKGTEGSKKYIAYTKALQKCISAIENLKSDSTTSSEELYERFHQSFVDMQKKAGEYFGRRRGIFFGPRYPKGQKRLEQSKRLCTEGYLEKMDDLRVLFANDTLIDGQKTFAQASFAEIEDAVQNIQTNVLFREPIDYEFKTEIIFTGYLNDALDEVKANPRFAEIMNRPDNDPEKLAAQYLLGVFDLTLTHNLKDEFRRVNYDDIVLARKFFSEVERLKENSLFLELMQTDPTDCINKWRKIEQEEKSLLDGYQSELKAIETQYGNYMNYVIGKEANDKSGKTLQSVLTKINSSINQEEVKRERMNLYKKMAHIVFLQNAVGKDDYASRLRRVVSGYPKLKERYENNVAELMANNNLLTRGEDILKQTIKQINKGSLAEEVKTIMLDSISEKANEKKQGEEELTSRRLRGINAFTQPENVINEADLPTWETVGQNTDYSIASGARKAFRKGFKEFENIADHKTDFENALFAIDHPTYATDSISYENVQSMFLLWIMAEKNVDFKQALEICKLTKDAGSIPEEGKDLPNVEELKTEFLQFVAENPIKGEGLSAEQRTGSIQNWTNLISKGKEKMQDYRIPDFMYNDPKVMRANIDELHHFSVTVNHVNNTVKNMVGFEGDINVRRVMTEMLGGQAGFNEKIGFWANVSNATMNLRKGYSEASFHTDYKGDQFKEHLLRNAMDRRLALDELNQFRGRKVSDISRTVLFNGQAAYAEKYENEFFKLLKNEGFTLRDSMDYLAGLNSEKFNQFVLKNKDRVRATVQQSIFENQYDAQYNFVHSVTHQNEENTEVMRRLMQIPDGAENAGRMLDFLNNPIAENSQMLGKDWLFAQMKELLNVDIYKAFTRKNGDISNLISIDGKTPDRWWGLKYAHLSPTEREQLYCLEVIKAIGKGEKDIEFKNYNCSDKGYINAGQIRYILGRNSVNTLNNNILAFEICRTSMVDKLQAFAESLKNTHAPDKRDFNFDPEGGKTGKAEYQNMCEALRNCEELLAFEHNDKKITKEQILKALSDLAAASQKYVDTHPDRFLIKVKPHVIVRRNVATKIVQEANLMIRNYTVARKGIEINLALGEKKYKTMKDSPTSEIFQAVHDYDKVNGSNSLTKGENIINTDSINTDLQPGNDKFDSAEYEKTLRQIRFKDDTEKNREYNSNLCYFEEIYYRNLFREMLEIFEKEPLPAGLSARDLRKVQNAKMMLTQHYRKMLAEGKDITKANVEQLGNIYDDVNELTGNVVFQYHMFSDVRYCIENWFSFLKTAGEFCERAAVSLNNYRKQFGSSAAYIMGLDKREEENNTGVDDLRLDEIEAKVKSKDYNPEDEAAYKRFAKVIVRQLFAKEKDPFCEQLRLSVASNPSNIRELEETVKEDLKENKLLSKKKAVSTMKAISNGVVREKVKNRLRILNVLGVADMDQAIEKGKAEAKERMRRGLIKQDPKKDSLIKLEEDQDILSGQLFEEKGNEIEEESFNLDFLTEDMYSSGEIKIDTKEDKKDTNLKDSEEKEPEKKELDEKKPEKKKPEKKVSMKEDSSEAEDSEEEEFEEGEEEEKESEKEDSKKGPGKNKINISFSSEDSDSDEPEENKNLNLNHGKLSGIGNKNPRIQRKKLNSGAEDQKHKGAQKYTKENTQKAIGVLKNYGKLSKNQKGYQQKLDSFITLYGATKYEANKSRPNKNFDENIEKMWENNSYKQVAEKLMLSYTGQELITMMSNNTIDKTIQNFSKNIDHGNEGPQIKPF